MGPGIPFAPSFPEGPTGPGGPYIEEINIQQSMPHNDNSLIICLEASWQLIILICDSHLKSTRSGRSSSTLVTWSTLYGKGKCKHNLRHHVKTLFYQCWRGTSIDERIEWMNSQEVQEGPEDQWILCVPSVLFLQPHQPLLCLHEDLGVPGGKRIQRGSISVGTPNCLGNNDSLFWF